MWTRPSVLSTANSVLRHKHLNKNDLDFDLSRLLKVRCNGAVGLRIYDFLLVFNSKHMV